MNDRNKDVSTCFYYMCLYLFFISFLFPKGGWPSGSSISVSSLFLDKVTIGPYGPVVTTSLFHGENEGSSPSGGVTTLKTIGRL